MEQEQETTEPEIVEQEMILDDTAVKSIASEVAAIFKPQFDDLQKGFDEKLAAMEPIVKKDLGGESEPKTINTIVGGTDIDKQSPELRFVKQIQASLTHDHGMLKAYQEHALDARQKAGYNNEGVVGEGGYIILQPEFEAAIERLLPQVGGMANEVNFVPISGNAVITNKGTNNVEFSKVLEGASKPAKKSAFSQQTITLNKYAAILLSTTELIEDQATDFWQDATQQFAYAYGKKIDEMVLTDNGTTSSEKGILHTAGVTLEPTSGAGSTVTWDDLLNAKYAVPGAAAPDGIYVMHRGTLNALRQLKDTTNQYLGLTAPFFTENGPVTPWGDRIVLTDTMPINGSTWVGTTVGAGVVYGNFKRYSKVYQKAGGMQLDVSDSATVVDNAGVTQNLWQNNLIGMKGEFRAVTFFKFPEAFCIIGQAPLS